MWKTSDPNRSIDPAQIMLLDEIAANAWPAPIEQQLEGWRLRAGNGITRRANSVLAPGPLPTYPHWLAEIEEFYHSRELPVKFFVSEASDPGLDKMLAGMNYSKDAPTSVQIAECATVLEACPTESNFIVEWLDKCNERWLEEFMRIEGWPEVRRPVYRQIFSAIGPRACFALALAGGEAVAIGTAVAERGWTGLFNICTAPECRRRGAGRAVIRTLVEWGVSAGSKHVYLQVMLDNAPANALYARLGFEHLYGYHFREEQWKPSEAR